MNHREVQKKLINTAAVLARGDDLDQLYQLCECQKTITTARLKRVLDGIQDRMREHSTVVRQGYDALSDLGAKS